MGENQEAPGNEGQAPQASQQTPETWETWLAGQEDAVRSAVTPLYEAHTQGLRSALETERQQRKDLAKKLAEATQQMEAGSQARTQLEQVSAQLTEAQRRAEFYDDAARPEVGCANPRLAYLAAVESQAFDSLGNPDWKVLKERFPELFRVVPQRAPAINAGAGNQAPKPFDMNTALRQAAGRNSL